MNRKPISKLIKICEDTLKGQGFKKSTMTRYLRCFLHLNTYMSSNGLNMYDETVGEKYQFSILTEGTVNDYALKCASHSINFINDILNTVPVRKKRILLKGFPLPGKFGKHIAVFLEALKIESRPAENTIRMYMIALSHFAIRMHQDRIYPSNLDNASLLKLMLSAVLAGSS